MFALANKICPFDYSHSRIKRIAKISVRIVKNSIFDFGEKNGIYHS